MAVKIKVRPEPNGKFGATLICGKVRVEVHGMNSKKSAIGKVQKEAHYA